MVPNRQPTCEITMQCSLPTMRCFPTNNTHSMWQQLHTSLTYSRLCTGWLLLPLLQPSSCRPSFLSVSLQAVILLLVLFICTLAADLRRSCVCGCCASVWPLRCLLCSADSSLVQPKSKDTWHICCCVLGRAICWISHEHEVREGGAKVSAINGRLELGAWVEDVLALGAKHLDSALTWDVGCAHGQAGLAVAKHPWAASKVTVLELFQHGGQPACC
mmetsp:Transcript_11705/g.20800  ORF Transcript_11705/g.20800 Transcript_11705/m.20800 type:complete len:217 (-) Transcript_11705:622-1272(-)